MDVFGFWIFLSVVIAGALWSAATRRRSKHETIRALIDKGHGDDDDLINKILDSGGKKQPSLQFLFKIAGVIALASGLGLALMSFIVAEADPPSANGLLAVASFGACLGLGFLVVAALAARASRDQASG